MFCESNVFREGDVAETCFPDTTELSEVTKEVLNEDGTASPCPRGSGWEGAAGTLPVSPSPVAHPGDCPSAGTGLHHRPQQEAVDETVVKPGR